MNREMMEYDGRKGEIRLGDQRLGEESLRAFFGLATLGKMIRFGLKQDGKVVVIERVPEAIEAIYAELSRLFEKYKDNPIKGFKEIQRTMKFAERIGASELVVAKQKDEVDP